VTRPAATARRGRCRRRNSGAPAGQAYCPAGSCSYIPAPGDRPGEHPRPEPAFRLPRPRHRWPRPAVPRRGRPGMPATHTSGPQHPDRCQANPAAVPTEARRAAASSHPSAAGRRVRPNRLRLGRTSESSGTAAASDRSAEAAGGPAVSARTVVSANRQHSRRPRTDSPRGRTPTAQAVQAGLGFRVRFHVPDDPGRDRRRPCPRSPAGRTASFGLSGVLYDRSAERGAGRETRAVERATPGRYAPPAQRLQPQAASAGRRVAALGRRAGRAGRSQAVRPPEVDSNGCAAAPGEPRPAAFFTLPARGRLDRAARRSHENRFVHRPCMWQARTPPEPGRPRGRAGAIGSVVVRALREPRGPAAGRLTGPAPFGRRHHASGKLLRNPSEAERTEVPGSVSLRPAAQHVP
jgi:hypothetical protein